MCDTTFNLLDQVLPALSCSRQTGSRVLVLRSDEGISCLTEAPKIVTTSDHTTQMFLVGDMIAEAIDHCPNQEEDDCLLATVLSNPGIDSIQS